MVRKKKMTERQAWLWMAKKWEEAGRDCNNQALVKLPEILTRRKSLRHTGNCYGICIVIGWLEEAMLITPTVAISMMDKINEKLRSMERYKPYVWSLTKRGATSRAKFCQLQAEKVKQCQKTKSGKASVKAVTAC